MKARFILATVDGLAYEIPEMWLVGASRSMKVAEAIQYWHAQAQMARSS